MTEPRYYGAVVIGSGQGGNPLATALAKSGEKTAIVEREHVGGTCINEGCTPTKTMIASAKVAYLDRRSADYGIRNGSVAVDMVKVRQRKRDIVESFRGGSERRIRRAGVDLVWGEASFVGPKELEVRLNGGETVRLSADNIFINTGTRPIEPPIEGLASVPTLDSTTIMELEEVPAHLLVLGGGYVGLEFAQMFRRFGSEVTVIQWGPAAPLARGSRHWRGCRRNPARGRHRGASRDPVPARRTDRCWQGPTDGEHAQRRTQALRFASAGVHGPSTQHRTAQSVRGRRQDG